MDKFSDVVDGGDGVGALRRAPAPLQRPFSSSSLLTRRAGSFASRPGTAGARAATTVGSRSRPATAASSRRGFGDEGGDARAEPYVSRYGCVGRRPDSAVPFGDAPRQTGAPSGTDAPFSYLPPPASARDPNSDLRNPAQVVMAVSTREQWFNVHQKVQSSDSAGPGAYDLPRGERVLLHVAHHGVGFPHDARESRPRPATPSAFDYRAAEALSRYVLRQAAAVSFPAALRPLGRPDAGGPAPRDVRAAYEALVGRHAAAYKFGHGPAHERPLSAAAATASVPIRDGHRSRKRPVVGMPLGRAPRWGSVASTF